MKRAQSDLIDAVLLNIRNGYITGKASSSGPTVLERLAGALQAIKAGTDPDEALAITRQAGNPGDPFNLALAVLIHQHRKAGDTWGVVDHVVTGWTRRNGREPVSLVRLKAIYRQHRRALEQRDAVNELIARINGT